MENKMETTIFCTRDMSKQGSDKAYNRLYQDERMGFFCVAMRILGMGQGVKILDKDDTCCCGGRHICTFTSAPMHRDATFKGIESQASSLGIPQIFHGFSNAIVIEVGSWT